ncbi:site-specific integrase [Hyphomicrobium sp.]|uniref:site-specific integrase n=1 Tax=Hyphomicrobium sp. TaxID=82 RepID=UPI001D65145D|nr:site-specific integrase [Hyphomicrobium sp.]MBY0561472.1 site-specific integrase [Hyphomicrobium sp.]
MSIVNEISSGTERKYRQQWRLWQEFAEVSGIAPLPAEPKMVAKFLSDRAEAGQAQSTLRVVLGAIKAMHDAQGLSFDSKDAAIVAVMARNFEAPVPRANYALPSQDWLIANFVTIEDVEWRVLRALQTIRAAPDPDAKFRGGLRAVWPSFTQDWTDLAWNWNSRDERTDMEKRATQFRATPRDNSDCLTALEWLRGVPVFVNDGLERPQPRILSYRDPLTKKQIQLLGWMASGYGPSFIASRLNISKQAVHRRYKDVILQVFNAAIQHALEAARRAARRSEISGPSLKDDLDTYNAKAHEGGGADRGEEGPIRL